MDYQEKEKVKILTEIRRMARESTASYIILGLWLAYILSYIINFIQIFTTEGSTQIIKVVGAIFGLAPLTVWF